MFICRLCFPMQSQAGKSALGILSQGVVLLLNSVFSRRPQEEVVVSFAVLPKNGTFLGTQTEELGLEKQRSVIPVCSSCRISFSPARSSPSSRSLCISLAPAGLVGALCFPRSALYHPLHCRKELGERADPCESCGGNLEAFQAACGFPVLDFGRFHFQLSTLFPREAQHNPCRNSGSIYRQLSGHLRSTTNNFRFKQRLLVIHSFLL